MISADLRDDILGFLKAPVEFARAVDPASRAAWLDARSLLQLDWPLMDSQVRAWDGIAESRVALLLGPPGTGKTFTLSAMALGYLLARRKAGQPCRVFVTAFTRNAIINVLENLAEKLAVQGGDDVPVNFLGRSSALPDGVRSLQVSNKELPGTRKHLKNPYSFTGCTVWTLYRLIKDAPEPIHFDLVCLDEASQMLLSHGLMALAGLAPSGKVLVVGDDRQLPPIRESQPENVDVRRLSSSVYDFLKVGGVPEFQLEETFRLNAPLVSFPERTFYEGKYRSAGPVEGRRLELQADWREGLAEWEVAALSPEHPVCILLHDGPPTGTSNPFEVDLTCGLVQHLYRAMGAPADFWSKRLAVISPHRAQNALVRRRLEDSPAGANCMVETVERIQGKERDAIIVSFTVSDPEFALAEGKFLFSPNRLNVMVTRARTKLIILVSRRLLEVVPTEEEVLEQAQFLREYIFDSQPIGPVVSLAYPVAMRVKTFGEPANPLPDTPSTLTQTAAELPEFSPKLQELYRAIQKLSLQSEFHGWVADFKLRKEMVDASVGALRNLLVLGKVHLRRQEGRFGPFWSARPHESSPPFAVDYETVRARIEEALHDARRGRSAPRYEDVRNRFVWLGPDGSDLFRDVVDRLVSEGMLEFSRDQDGNERLGLTDHSPVPLEELPPLEPLQDADFEVLNTLEDLEIARINFGVTETWLQTRELPPNLKLHDLDACLQRLRSHGFVMYREGLIRSRMAELAREIRYVKQRFKVGDADKQPFLVRSLKMERIQRKKPVRNVPLSRVLTACQQEGASEVKRALEGCAQVLRERWQSEDPRIAGFQERAFVQLLNAWLADGESTFVITADTGSGKTEAACLPMIVGSLVDAQRGIRGTRAVLVYPRIRLGANQAQRITGYLAALSRVPDLPLLTIGLQNASVPNGFGSMMHERYNQEWETIGGRYRFPFFNCPEPACDSHLELTPGPTGIDTLGCPQCQWRYAGWVGSKNALQQTPPHFFLPVTESLHRWQREPRYGRLFGDVPGWPSPRAVLADEVHLYSHIHGAQVGFTLRRLLARLSINAGRAPLAVGMSATLSRPDRVWGELCGRSTVQVLAARPDEQLENVRGREYFYFVQPEVESRGKDIAGASTTIQSLMCLAHGMRRRTGGEGGYRGVVFLDSIDKVKRVHGDYLDAEEHKQLATLRTHLYGNDASGQPCAECCGSPESCDRFHDGECWYFAATDAAQRTASGRYRPGCALKVSEHPVYSGTSGGRIEELLKRSDLLFATSTLEVGYDDPEMILVYQHYAPVNLASFVQRKGRGGRGVDDRPVTGVTLSIYSARDSWYYRNPRRMLDESEFVVPLNMGNYFVLRGQAVTCIFDALARHFARNPNNRLSGQRLALPPSVNEAASQLMRAACGSDAFDQLGVEDAAGLLELLPIGHDQLKLEEGGPLEWSQQIAWVPARLFDAINLPMLAVRHPDQQGLQLEDITLAFSECAPGNMTRRYGSFSLNWVPPTEGRSLYLSTDCYRSSSGFSFTGNPQTGEELSAELPMEVRRDLGEVHPNICRPCALELVNAGKMWGGQFEPRYHFDTLTRVVSTSKSEHTRPITHKSRGDLRSFVVVSADVNRAVRPDLSESRLFKSIQSFVGSGREKRTGLRATRVYWGADVSLRLDHPKDNEASLTQFFIHPKTKNILLHGYQLETEGVQFHLDSHHLDAFLDVECVRLQGSKEERYYRGRMLGYLLESRCTAAGMNCFEVNRVTELLISAAAHAELKADLTQVLNRWDTAGMNRLCQKTFQSLLKCHPLLTPQRLERLTKIFEHPRFHSILREVMAEVASAESLRGYLRSMILHGIGIRLRDLFVLYGHGDERRVLWHARLPMQFASESEDVITVFENGDHGDGTTRTFLEHLPKIFESIEASLGDCPNAAEDHLLERMFSHVEHHHAWRQMAGRELIDSLREEFELGDGTGLNRMVRLLHGSEGFGGKEFALFDLTREVREIEARLTEEMPRPPSAWELVTRAVQSAQTGDGLLSRLLAAYRNLERAHLDDTLSPENRLADQVYRLAVKLCPDGCDACLHGSSDLMSDSLARSLASRKLMARLSDFKG